MKFSTASISIIAENGEETPIGIADVSNLKMSYPSEPEMVPNPLPRYVGQTITIQIPEKVRSKLLGIILLHHRRN